MALAVVSLNVIGAIATLFALIGSSLVACCKYDRAGFGAYMILSIISLIISVVSLVVFLILVDLDAATLIFGLVISAWPLVLRTLGIVYGAKGRTGAYEGDSVAAGGAVAQGTAVAQ